MQKQQKGEKGIKNSVFLGGGLSEQKHSRTFCFPMSMQYLKWQKWQ